MSTLSDQLGLGASFRPGPFGWGEQTSPFSQGSQGEKFFNSLTSNEDKAAINTYVYRAKQKDPSSDGITGKNGILFALSNNPQYAAQALNYGPPRDSEGNVIPDRFVQSMMADTTPGYTGPSSGSSLFAQMLPFLTAYFLPGIGNAITSQLVSAGVVTAGATANALGIAIAKTAVGVAQGNKFEDVLKNVIVDTIVSTGSIKVASAINEIVGMPNVTNAIVSASSSAIKTAASGGNENDIIKSFTGGLTGSVAASAYIGAVNNASQTTSDLIQSGVGGYVIGGSASAINNVLNTLIGKINKQTFKSAEDIEYEKLKALDEVDAAVEAAFSTLTPSGTLTAEDIEYQKQKALDDLDAEVNKIFATVTVSPGVQSATLATVTVQATQNVTQEIIDLINSTVSPFVTTSPSVLPTVTTTFSELPTVTVLASPTVSVSVSPEIFSTVTVTPNVTQTLVDQILNTVTVSATPIVNVSQAVLPTVTVNATQDVTQTLVDLILNTVTVKTTPIVYSSPTVIPTVTVSSVSVSPTVFPTVDVITKTLIDEILSTVTVSGTQTVLPTVTVTGTQTFLPTVTVTSSVDVLPTVTVNVTQILIDQILNTVTVTGTPTVLPTVTVSSVSVSPIVFPTVTVRSTETILPTVTVRATSTVFPTVTVETTETVFPTVTVRATATVFPTVFPTVTVRATATVFPTVTVTGSVDVLPTVTITGRVTPTVTVTSTVRTTVSPTVSPIIKIFTTVTPPKRPTPPTPSSEVLAGALSLAPYRGAGEIEDPSTGKKRKNVWNEESLRLKDALGI